MSMTEWAKNEIDIIKKGACKMVYEELDMAFNAYSILVQDDTGMAKIILSNLLDHLPLTPITEEESAIWEVCFRDESAEKVTYQCKRLSSLFKDVYTDGKVTYHDINRVVCYDHSLPHVCGSYYGKAVGYVDEKFPITLPYMPTKEKYKVIMDLFLHNPSNADKTDWDTEGFHYIEYNGNRYNIGKYFHEDKEIAKEEFDRLKSEYLNPKEKSTMKEHKHE